MSLTLISALTSTLISTLLPTLISALTPSSITLSPARRVFSADLDRDGSDEVLIAHQSRLEARRWTGQEWGTLWSVEGPGVAQQITMHPHLNQLWVAWGRGVGQMSAPTTLSSLNPLTGQHRTVWSHQGGRAQVVQLQWVEIDTDPEPELALTHFVNKYHTRRVIIDQLNSSDQAPVVSVTSPIRMGTSWVLTDLDGRPGLEEVIGRVYGDVKGEYGDLSVQPFKLQNSALKLGQVMPSERGVKAMAVAQPELGGGLFFSDGWVAAYGKKARATLKRLHWVKGRAVIERLVDAPLEFTFFQFWQRRDPLSGAWVVFAQGNKGIDLITPSSEGPWQLRQLLKTPPIVNAAIGYSGGAWWIFTPHPQGAQAHLIGELALSKPVRVPQSSSISVPTPPRSSLPVSPSP